MTDITLQYTGETYTFRISVLPVALAEEVVWTSSNETLVSVDENGTIVAHGGIKGETVTITAACQEKSASCIVRFGFNDDPTILELSYSDVTLTRIGETLTIEITSGLTDEERSRVVWMTDNVSAAAVDDNGVVTAIASGTANITATLDGRMGACIIRVR